MKVPLLLPFVVVVSALAVSPPVPDVQILPSSTRKDSIVKIVRYGPHTLKKAEGTAAESKGVKTTIVAPGVQKPCVDCTLISMKGGVQYENGTEAIGPAVYLHHAAIINTGPEAKDGTCARPAYDLFFSTGNERSVLLYKNPDAKQNSGYYVKPSDIFVLQSEVINNELEEKQVWVYMTYEYLPGKPPGHQQTKVIWLSADNTTPCERKMDLNSVLETANLGRKLGAGELYPPNEKSFTLKSKPWTSPWTGNFIALGGHIHDGGVNTEIYHNDKLICDSRAKYEVGNSTRMTDGHVITAARHLVSMSGCRSSDFVKAGDKFHIVVNYDFEKNPGMQDKDGKLSPIMAAATLFIGAI